jgi:protein TonB
MRKAPLLPEDSAKTGVKPGDRLGFTLLLVAALHLMLILGVSFRPQDPPANRQSLEITLATFSSQEPPEQADYLAQQDQQGSGSLNDKASPKTTEQAPFQEQQVNKVAPPPAAMAQQPEPSRKAAIASSSVQIQKAEVSSRQQLPAKPLAPVATFDSSQLSSAIASLEAELAQDIQLYAKRPKIHRLNAASTMRDKGAWYKDEWRKKVELIGNLNYPAEARQQRLYGSLRMLVSINRDGTLYEVLILESSGEPVLDEAALRIVRLAAPFAPFTGDLADVDRLEIIRTWRFERGDRMSSR